MARRVSSVNELITFGKNTAGKVGRRVVDSTGWILHRAPVADTVQLAEALRTRVVGLPAGSRPIGNQAWHDFCANLTNAMLSRDPREFLRWPVIQQTMFVAQAAYLDCEFAYLRNRPSWSASLKAGCIETRVGSPPPYRRYPWTSGNTVHHLFHICRFIDATGAVIGNVDHVFELGGGYGNFCRLMFALGFSGRYCIFDLPPFSALQDFYLSAVGLLKGGTNGQDRNAGDINLTTDRYQAERFMQRASGHNSLFVATWSLSEMPISDRAWIERSLPSFRNILLAYQGEFEGVDNYAYFDVVKSQLAATHECASIDIDHIPGNKYLFGRRRN